MSEFNPALVTITRHRFSTTQGEASVFYAGEKLAQYGDTIRMLPGGVYQGMEDAEWVEVARKVMERRFAAAAAGEQQADDVMLRGSWRKAPAQCPIFMGLLTPWLGHDEFMALAGAWTAAYRVRCNVHADKALADLGLLPPR